MTIPYLVQKYKIKQLEVAFKKSSASIQQALNNTAIEFGVDNFDKLGDMCKSDPDWRSKNIDLMTNINNTLISNFNHPEVASQAQKKAITKIKVKSYSGKPTIDYNELYGIGGFNTPNHNFYFLNDGSIISAITFCYHGIHSGAAFTFDTNGPSKGPNRYGYDIFIYNTNKPTSFCTKESTWNELGNGNACYIWAIRNINPDDNTKGYWESLKL